jgi:hypothetical protein
MFPLNDDVGRWRRITVENLATLMNTKTAINLLGNKNLF